MKINDFRGDLTNVSAKIEALMFPADSSLVDGSVALAAETPRAETLSAFSHSTPTAASGLLRQVLLPGIEADASSDGDGYESDECAAGEATDKAQLSPMQCLGSVDFWLTCVCVSILSGAGLAYINTVGAMVHAVGGDSGMPV